MRRMAMWNRPRWKRLQYVGGISLLTLLLSGCGVTHLASQEAPANAVYDRDSQETFTYKRLRPIASR